MKSFLFSLFVVCALIVTECYCKCECDPNDNACVSDCVVEANSCVTSCHGNIECYESCIDDKWPSLETNAAIEELEEQRQRQEEEGVYREVLATTTVYSIISPSSSATTASASMSASTSAKQADATHSSSGSIVRSPTTIVLAVTVLFALFALK